MGPDKIVYIPKALIKHEVFDPNKRYHIHFEEMEEDQKRSKKSSY